MYIELHARSAFSFLEGSSLPEDLSRNVCPPEHASHGNARYRRRLRRTRAFTWPQKKSKIKAHIGAEVTCAPFHHPVILSRASAPRRGALAESKDPYQQAAEEAGIPRPARNDKAAISKSFRLPLLVSSRAGYQNLCRLITKMKLRAKKGEGAVQKKNSKSTHVASSA